MTSSRPHKNTSYAVGIQKSPKLLPKLNISLYSDNTRPTVFTPNYALERSRDTRQERSVFRLKNIGQGTFEWDLSGRSLKYSRW